MSPSSSHIRRWIAASFAAGAFLGIAGTGFAAGVLGSSVFSDVRRGEFDDGAIGEMYNLGIIKGYDNGNFGPNDPVTRGQLAVMLQRFRASLGETTVESSSSVRSSSSSSSSSSSVSSSSSSSSASSVPYSPNGSVRFSANVQSVAEGTTAQILVVRTGGAKGTVTVEYATTNGTAVSGTDYTETKGILTLAANQTSKSFTIPITNNPLPQGHKTFNVVLSNVTGGANIASPSTQVVTILDNQTSSSSSTSTATSSSSSSNPAGTMNLGASAYMVNEKGVSLPITVTRDGGSTGTVGISYGTVNGTATSGSEYTATSGTLTFNAGETTKTFNIPVNYNGNITGNKSFTIVIGTPTGGASLGLSTATVTVYDYESGAFGSGTVKFVKSTYNVSKSAGYIDIGIQRTGGTAGTVAVNYSTTPLTAAAGIDYTATSGTMTFQPGEMTKNVRVYVSKTGSSSNGKTFSVDLTAGANVLLGSPTSTTVTIDN